MKQILDPNQFLDAAYAALQRTFLKSLENGHFFNVSGSYFTPMEFDANGLLREALSRLNRARILESVVLKVEEVVATRVAAEVVQRIGGDINRVMSSQETREAVTAAVKAALFAKETP